MSAGSRPEEGTLRVLGVTGAICLVCATAVSGAATWLAPRIAANREHERQQRLLELVHRQPGLRDLMAELGSVDVRSRVVDLASGEYLAGVDPERFDARSAAADPLRSVALDPAHDAAGLGRRETQAVVHEIERDGRLELVILPLRGQGYASTLVGFLALAGDANTVVGLTFTEHGETPGLGARIDDPEWQALFQGKRVRDAAGRVRLGLAAGPVEPGSEDAPYLVDGLSGATITTHGVTGLLRFWLGDEGFGPYLRRIAP